MIMMAYDYDQFMMSQGLNGDDSLGWLMILVRGRLTMILAVRLRLFDDKATNGLKV